MLFVYFLASPTAHDQLQAVPPSASLPLPLPLFLFSVVSLPTPPPLLLSLIIKSNKLFSIDLLAASNKQHPRNVADPEVAPLPTLHSPPPLPVPVVAVD